MGKTIENLFVHVRAIRKMTISQSDRAARSIVDHMEIIEALERRDTELAERLVRQHSLDLAAHVDEALRLPRLMNDGTRDDHDRIRAVAQARRAARPDPRAALSIRRRWPRCARCSATRRGGATS